MAMSSPYTRGPSYTIPVDPQESPTSNPQPENEVYILDLRPFVKTPKVDFGTVSIGSYVTKEIWIRNSYDVAVQAEIEKVTKEEFEAEPQSMFIDGGMKSRMLIGWLPTKEGPTRGLIRLLVNDSFRVQFLVLGSACGSAKMRKSRHPGSRRHGVDFSRSCQQLSNIENISASLQSLQCDDGDGDSYRGNRLQGNDSLSWHQSSPFTHPSGSCTFVLDRFRGNADVGRSPKTPFRMIDNRIESFADDESTENIRRATYCKKDLLSTRTTTDVHPLRNCNNSNNNNNINNVGIPEVQKQAQKNVMRQLFVGDKKVSIPLLKQNQKKYKLPAKDLKRENASKTLNQDSFHSPSRNLHGLEKQSRSPSAYSPASPPSAKSKNPLRRNINLVGMSQVTNESNSLSRYGTYSKLNEELKEEDDDEEESFEDSIECVDEKPNPVDRDDRPGLQISSTTGDDDKTEDVRSFDRKSENQKCGIEDENDAFFLSANHKSTENVKLSCQPKATTSKQKYIYREETNLPDICQDTVKSKHFETLCKEIDDEKTCEDHLKFHGQNATSTPKMKSGKIGACTLSPIKKTSETAIKIITKSNLKPSLKAEIISPARIKLPPDSIAVSQNGYSGSQPNPNTPHPSVTQSRHKSSANSVKKFTTAVKDNVRSKSGSFKSSPRPPDASAMSTFSQVPKSKLKLKKLKKEEPVADIVTTANPYATKNAHHDERWIEKQERGFTEWMNFALSPPEFFTDLQVQAPLTFNSMEMCTSDDSVCVNVCQQKLSTDFLTPLKSYSTDKKVNQLRRAAYKLYSSTSVTQVVERVEREVENGRLAVRTDRLINNDYGLRTSINNMLFSYNLLWLRVGIETVYGRIINLEANAQRSIEKFLDAHFFSCPSIASAFAHPVIAQLYNHGFQTTMAKFTLKKFLLLVYFLDVAKSKKLIGYNPCLFNRSSFYKSSRDILLAFSRICLRGEGNLVRHLSNLGCVVAYEQTTMEEFDYAVKNLSQDLRDGIRLARLVEVMIGDWSLTRKLLPPPLSKAKKMFNVEVVLEALRQRCVNLVFDLNEEFKAELITSKDIVEGHREKTLQLLWKIISSFQVGLLLDEDILIDELNILFEELPIPLRHQVDRCSSHIPEINVKDSTGSTVHSINPLLSLLLKWCRVVCINYGLRVENFTTCFSDGRAFCYLIHHYYPLVLPLSSIQSETTLSWRGIFNLDEEEEDVVRYIDGDNMNDLLNNEKENFKLLKMKLAELGGIPPLINWNNMTTTMPDEKLVITCLTFMCNRMMETRKEMRASRIIQRFWRNFAAKKKMLAVENSLKSIIESKPQDDKSSIKRYKWCADDQIQRPNSPAMVEYSKLSLKNFIKKSLSSSPSLVTNNRSPPKSSPDSNSKTLPWPSQLEPTSAVKHIASDTSRDVKHCRPKIAKKSNTRFCIIKSSSLSYRFPKKPKKDAQMYVRSPVNGDLIKKSDINKVVFDSGKLGKVMEELKKGYEACQIKLNAKKNITTEKWQVPSIDLKSQTNAQDDKISSVDDISNEKHLNRITLDYDEEVVENLGLNMIDRTGTIYHTPKKQTPMKSSFNISNKFQQQHHLPAEPTRPHYQSFKFTNTAMPPREYRDNFYVDNHIEEVASSPTVEIRMDESYDNNYLDVLFPAEVPKIVIAKPSRRTHESHSENGRFNQTLNDPLYDNASINQTLNYATYNFGLNGLRASKPSAKEVASEIANINEFSSGDFDFRSPDGRASANRDVSSNRLKVKEKTSDDNLFAVTLDQKLFPDKTNQDKNKPTTTGRTSSQRKASPVTSSVSIDVALDEFYHINSDFLLSSFDKTSCNNVMIDAIDECCQGIKNLSIASQAGSPCSERKKEKVAKEKRNSKNNLLKVSLNLLKRAWRKYLLMMNTKLKYPAAKRYVEQALARQNKYSMDKDHKCFVLRQEFSNQFLSMICTDICKSWYITLHETRIAKCQPSNFETLFINKHWRNMKQDMLTTKRSIESYQTFKKESSINHETVNLKQENVVYCDNCELTKIVVVQSVIRSFMAKLNFQRNLQSIIKIQSCVRRFLVQRRMKKHLNFDNILQWTGPSYTQRMQRLVPEECVHSAYIPHTSQNVGLAISKHCSSFSDRIQIWNSSRLMRSCDIMQDMMRHEAACKIQAMWRGYYTKKNYLKLKESMRCLRKAVLSLKTFKSFSHLLWSNALNNIAKLGYAAKIQAAWRRYIAKRDYVKLKNCLESKGFLERLQILRNRQLFLELIWYDVLERKIEQESARKIQMLWRCHRAHSSYLDVRRKIVFLQAAFRNCLVRREHQRIMRNIVDVQRFCRGYMERERYKKKIKSIIYLQTCFKMVAKRQEFLRIRRCIVTVQSLERRRICMKIFKQQRDWVIRLQCLARMYLERKARILEENKAIKIQSVVRRYLARKEYLKNSNKIKKCQSIVRGWLTRKHMTEVKKKVIVVQSYTKMVLQRNNYLKTIEQIKYIQRHSVAYLYRERHAYVMKVVKVQALVKGYLSRQRYERNLKNIVVIQSLARGAIARRRLSMRCWVAVNLHCHVQGMMTRYVIGLLNACILYRLKLVHSALRIQTSWRGYIARRDFQCKMRGILRLQAELRGFQVRREMAKIMRSIILIQNWWRRVLRKRKVMMMIQMEIEMFRWNMMERERVCTSLKRTIMATKIQCCYRRYQRLKIESRAAIKIQAFWRGRMVRKMNPEARPVLRRLRVATRRAKRGKNLYSKTVAALNNFLKYKNLSSILEALVIMDTVTRYSPICCEKVAEGRAMHSIVLLIQSCNRSVPHQELVKYSLNVMLNLAKCRKTSEALFRTDSLISTIVGVMVVYKEKEEIFMIASKLIVIFAEDSNMRVAIANTDKVAEKFRAIHDFLSRKYESEKKRKTKQLEATTDFPVGHFCCHCSEGVRDVATEKVGAKVPTFSRSFQVIQHLMAVLDLPMR